MADEGDSVGALWRFLQAHTGLLRRAVTFFAVATYAGGDKVFPAVFAAVAARFDMIDRKVRTRRVTILTTVIIAREYVLAVE